MPSSPAMTRGYPNDWIELYNTTEDSIDISGWFLSNKGATELDLMNYQIPDETIIPSDDYVVFTQNDHFCACFTLSKNGDCVYLSYAVDKGGHLTGFRQQEDFDASECNVSFGRHLKSTGTYNFVAMSSSTYELPNAAPKVGPIVISEIMYHPDWLNGSNYNNDEFEYIELYNTSLDEDVTLFDASTNTPWKFTQGIDYTFSTDSPVTIPAGECIVIVKNPDAFSVRYPAVSSSIIYGP